MYTLKGECVEDASSRHRNAHISTIHKQTWKLENSFGCIFNKELLTLYHWKPSLSGFQSKSCSDGTFHYSVCFDWLFCVCVEKQSHCENLVLNLFVFTKAPNHPSVNDFIWHEYWLFKGHIQPKIVWLKRTLKFKKKCMCKCSLNLQSVHGDIKIWTCLMQVKANY